MDPVIFIIASLITVYLLNIFLGYLQLKDFNKNYIELKRCEDTNNLSTDEECRMEVV